MAHLLNIPVNVMLHQLLPHLDHNDILRLRRVSKQTKISADAYLWTPQPGHQGNWELKIDCSEEDKRLEAFLQLGLPPPSRLHIANMAEMAPSDPMSFFEDELLEEFLERYGKFVTHLRVDKLFFPFTSAKEMGFYEKLVNLKKLHCFEMVTVGGAAQFEKKTRNAEGSFLIRPTFKNLIIFELDHTDCTDSMWAFINGVSNQLEELLHPFQIHNGNGNLPRSAFRGTNFNHVQQLIERRGMKSQRGILLYDWKYLLRTEPLELLRAFASCLDNGVMIKHLKAHYLDCLLCDEHGRIAWRDEVIDSITGDWFRNSKVNYERNLFVGSVIHSLVGVSDNVFLMEMPALESIGFKKTYSFSQIYPRSGVGYPQWPNLKRMHFELSYETQEHVPFLLRNVKRPKLEELSLFIGGNWVIPIPMDLGKCCGNLKKLIIDRCDGDNNFFLALWEGLPLLEDVTLEYCWKLTHKGFVGNSVAGTIPAFLKLEKLKRLTIGLGGMPGLTNTAFETVFRYLKLSSFKLTSFVAIKSITIAGIQELHTGPFAETIEKLDLKQLKLQDVSKEELNLVASRFRSSQML